MYRVAILTSDSIRHKYFFSKFLKAKNIEVIKCFSEQTKSSKSYEYLDLNNISRIHFNERTRVEFDFFNEYVHENFENDRWIEIPKGFINTESFGNDLASINPDFIVCYGCSIVSDFIIDKFEKNKILNIHLGLSPYYLGSGTNFIPLVENKPELVGYTLMFIDEGIDTGDIIHQGRPTINVFDNSHHVGCKVIREMADAYIKLIENFDKVTAKDQPCFDNAKVCYRRDCTAKSIRKMYANISNGMFLDYLKKQNIRNSRYQIIQQENIF